MELQRGTVEHMAMLDPSQTNVPTGEELERTYRGRRVLVTGHTGFKGSWLTSWLRELGAQVTGFALAPGTEPSMFDVLALEERCHRHVIGDVRDADAVRACVRDAEPEIVFHLAAQALVRESYERPLETLATNVMGTAHLLEALRQEKSNAAVVVVTSDKCYENQEWDYGYREDEPMGGHDVYSMSKGAAELVVSSWRRSFFEPAIAAGTEGVWLASARAGNVIGGGDFAKDRIVPDVLRALSAKQPVFVRNPRSVRPWQHVLEPLGGYLLLGARLCTGSAEERSRICQAWNFGPETGDTRTVAALVESFIHSFGEGEWKDGHRPGELHEAKLLRLSIEKAHARLGWRPRWAFPQTVQATASWYAAWHRGAGRDELRNLTAEQIRQYVLG
ncbi:CDP-glucose 4,6-dehydratase [Pendulispora rubella]|uniref:CDP-glucose 4,6-dehydratase n=1 Tax=Pendulispora rubella TaxID=2741070 RepID=A0ABZ2L6A3_9BACT